ncbi:hypothetical protein [Bacteroides acidifaciens]|uniref:hypothetical protein n=1 Tax=Bacteroides acidifaciens TaxID=85831 RepID=UPI002557DF99|nr:hypothetical protein [Bacteroides acidifaciens]
MEDRITKAQMYHETAQALLLNGFCEGEWVTLYKHLTQYPLPDEDVEYDLWYWCYVAQPSHSQNLLRNYDADLDWTERSALDINNHFIPHIKVGLESIITVLRFDSGDIHKKQIRVNDDLIFMFYLYEKIEENGDRYYVQFDNGHEKTIIIITEDEVKIRHQYLYDYLASKKLDLFCVIRSELNLSPALTHLIDCDYHMTGHAGMTRCIDDFSIENLSFAVTGFKFQSWYKGKRLFPHKEFGEFKSSFYPEYAEFVIGYDRETCSEIKVKSDEDGMDYQRSFFNRAVLEKYRSDYNVRIEPFYIDASPFYALKCNNDNTEFIWAYLKNLRCLPYNEQLHWAAYNIIPPITLPEEYQYDHYANWASKGRLIEYNFRDLFKRTNKKWFDTFGWYLFKELQGSQRYAVYHLYSLGEDKEESFKSLLKTMNLVLSESINSEELKKLQYKYPKDSKGIRKLTVVLESNGYIKSLLINFLLKLNTMRSEFTDSHINSSDMSDHLKEALGFIGLSLETKNYKEASINLFNKGIEAFNFFNGIIDNLTLNTTMAK